MAELTEAEKRRHGDGFGGYSSKRELDYQVSWREQVAKEQQAKKNNQGG